MSEELGREPTDEEEIAHNDKYRPIVTTRFASVITKRMKEKYEQREPGQVQRDVERLLGGTIKIDGVSHRVVNQAPSSLQVVGVQAR